MKKTIMSRIKNLFSEAQTDLEKTRQQIQQLQMERQEIYRASCTKEEAIGRIDVAVESLASRYLQKYRGLSILNGESASCDPGVLRQDVQDVGSLEFWCWLLPDVMKSKMGTLVDQRLIEHPQGLPHGERTAKLAELDSQIYALEVQEESLIDEAEAVGVNIQRRPDADVRAVLNVRE